MFFDHLSIFGYLDAGTGSFILQAIVGTALGIIVAVRSYIRRFISAITNRGKVETAPKDAER